MSLGKKIIINEAGGYDDPRLTGSPSVANAKFVGTVGTEAKVYYNTSTNPNSSYSNVTVGSSYIQDLQWDGFTWIAATGNGVYQTSNSSASGGWTNVVSGGAWNFILPTIGGNIVGRGGSSSGNMTIAYTSTVDGSVSSSNWSTKSLPFIGYGFNGVITPTRIVMGRRRDATGGPQYYYTSTDEDWFIDSGMTGWEVTPTNNWEWGNRLAYSYDDDKFIGSTRSYAMWYGATLGGSTTSNTPSGFSEWAHLSYQNGYYFAVDGGSSKYKTTYNGGWSSESSSTNTHNTPWLYNGTYYVSGMNYANTNAQAIAYKTSIPSGNSYVSSTTLGSASASYLRVFKPSVVSDVGAWQNFGSASPTFAA